MKQKNREALERAAGILDGLSFSIEKGGWHDALVVALDIIDAVLSDEEERKEED